MAKINIDSAPGTGGGGGGGNLQLLNGAAMDATLRAVADTANTASPLKLSTAGVQSTTKIQITTADTNYIDAEDSSGNNRFTVGRDPSSQQVNVDFASNPTGSTTIVGAIRTYVDGVNLSEVMTFREDGNVGVNTTTPGAKLDVHSASATVAQFNKTGSGNSYIQQLTAGAAKWKHGFTSASGAFDIIDDVNALTRLSLLNTGQLKLNAYTATSSFPGTTAGFLAFDATGNILSVASPATSPSGVAGSVQFSDGTAFASDATNFFWDDTNNRLGIGTNAPTTPLQVNTSSASLNGILVNQTGGTNNFSNIGFANGGTIKASLGMNLNTGEVRLSALSGGYFPTIYSNGNEALRIDTSGNVGIATNSPTARLHVKGSGATSATTSLLVQNSSSTQLMNMTDDGKATIGTNASNSGALLFQFPQVGTNGVFWGDNFSAIYGSITLSRGTGEMRFFTNAGGYFQTFYAGGSERMRLVDGGLIIQGATLNASATLQADSTTKGFLPPRMTTAQKLAISTPAAGLQVYDSTLNQMSYYNGTTWINF